MRDYIYLPIYSDTGLSRWETQENVNGKNEIEADYIHEMVRRSTVSRISRDDGSSRYDAIDLEVGVFELSFGYSFHNLYSL
jgi:hypothetical protein